MIDIKALEARDEGASYFEVYKRTLEGRKFDPKILDQLLELNQERKKWIHQVESERAAQKKLSQEMAKIKREGLPEKEIFEKAQKLSALIKDLEMKSEDAERRVHDLLMTLPNKCHETVPFGRSSEENVQVRKVGEPKSFSFSPKEHWEIGEKLGILDFKRAGKVTGARFVFLIGLGARLERALISLMLDVHTREHGYTEMMPPFIANSQSFIGVGQFPKFVNEVFHLTGSDYHLIPTAEVPVTNFYAEEILNEESLPQTFAAYTPCFRAEAGSYGQDTKGIIRQHQFNKVELVRLVHPDLSYEQHELLTQHAEKILTLLELPYRVVSLCTGDIGFSAAKCYDLEVWLPGQGVYREISSCSNFEDFQARRANIRFRSKGGKPRFVHTLNGSGLAIGRTVVAILENFQQEDGSVVVPEALRPYMGGISILK